MTPTLVIVVVALLAGGLLLASLRTRSGGRDDVERFHRARTLTTSWAEQYQRGEVPSPYPRAEDEEPVDPARPAEAATAGHGQGPTLRHGRARNSAT